MKKDGKMELKTVHFPPITLIRIRKLIEAGYFPHEAELIRTAVGQLLAQYFDQQSMEISSHAEIFEVFKKVKIIEKAAELLHDNSWQKTQAKMRKEFNIEVPTVALHEIDLLMNKGNRSAPQLSPAVASPPVPAKEQVEEEVSDANFVNPQKIYDEAMAMLKARTATRVAAAAKKLNVSNQYLQTILTRLGTPQDKQFLKSLSLGSRRGKSVTEIPNSIRVYDLALEGKSNTEIANLIKIKKSQISAHLQYAKKVIATGKFDRPALPRRNREKSQRSPYKIKNTADGRGLYLQAGKLWNEGKDEEEIAELLQKTPRQIKFLLAYYRKTQGIHLKKGPKGPRKNNIADQNNLSSNEPKEEREEPSPKEVVEEEPIISLYNPATHEKIVEDGVIKYVRRVAQT